jgi:phage terminase large subunit-like protein
VNVDNPVAEVYRRFRQKQQLIDWFEPLPYQQEAFSAKNPVQLIEGGNRSGKTHLAIAKIVSILLDKHPTISRSHPMKVRIIATVMREGAQGIILDKLRQLLPVYALQGGSWDKAYKSMDNLIILRKGDIIQLMADSQDVQTHRGDSIDIAMIDEECREEIFDETLTRLVDRNGILIMSMTPHNGMTWSFKKLVKASRRDSSVGYFHLDTLSNYTINRKEWIKNSALLSEKEFSIRIKGERVANEGLVYFMFSDQTHIIQPFELPEGTQLFLGVDFGLNNPHAGSLWAITPEGRKYIIDEYYVSGRTVDRNGEAQGRWVREKWGKYKLRWVVVDPMSGEQREGQSGEKNHSVYRKAFCSEAGFGKVVPVLLGDRTKGAVEHRINCMRELLTPDNSGLSELLMFSNCVNHMSEFEEYVWNTRKDENLNQYERPKDAHNHLMNAAEYVSERKPGFMQSIYKPIERMEYELQYGSIGR